MKTSALILTSIISPTTALSLIALDAIRAETISEDPLEAYPGTALPRLGREAHPGLRVGRGGPDRDRLRSVRALHIGPVPAEAPETLGDLPSADSLESSRETAEPLAGAGTSASTSARGGSRLMSETLDFAAALDFETGELLAFEVIEPPEDPGPMISIPILIGPITRVSTPYGDFEIDELSPGFGPVHGRPGLTDRNASGSDSSECTPEARPPREGLDEPREA